MKIKKERDHEVKQKNKKERESVISSLLPVGFSACHPVDPSLFVCLFVSCSPTPFFLHIRVHTPHRSAYSCTIKKASLTHTVSICQIHTLMHCALRDLHIVVFGGRHTKTRSQCTKNI